MTCRRRRSPGQIHVFRSGKEHRWIVASGGRTISRHRWQRTAVGAAIRTAKRRHVDVLTHGRSGRIRSKDSYGNESPVRDTEH
jgi:hypothetical protein